VELVSEPGPACGDGGGVPHLKAHLGDDPCGLAVPHRLSGAEVEERVEERAEAEAAGVERGEGLRRPVGVEDEAERLAEVGVEVDDRPAAAALGLLDAWKLSSIPSALNVPAFDAAMTSAVRAGRVVAWLTTTM